MAKLIFASLLAGILGGVMAYSVLALLVTGRINFLRDFFETAPIPPVVIERRAEIILRQEEALTDALKKIEASLGTIVPRASKFQIPRPIHWMGTPKFQTNPKPETVYGSALAVTDDGWLVTRETNLPPANQLAVRDRAGNIIPVVDAKKDPWAGLTFLKLATPGEFRAATFPQTPLELGTFLAVVRFEAGELEVFPTYITSISYKPKAISALDESTELLTRQDHLRDELPSRFKNNFAIRLDATIAGVVNGNTLLSGRLLAARLSLLPETDKFSSPDFGFNYFDNEKVMVTNVAAGSAAKSGLRVGDRIMAVNGTPLARDTVFAEVLAGLNRKKSVTMRVERGTSSIDIEIPTR